MGFLQFRNLVREHIINNPSVFTKDGVPVVIARHFFIKEHDGTITQEEREIDEKITRLMSSLISNDADDVVPTIIDCLIDYQDNEISIRIEPKKNEIEIELIFDDKVTLNYLRTNAFIPREEPGMYFDSMLKVDTVGKEDQNLLGRIIELHAVK